MHEDPGLVPQNDRHETVKGTVSVSWTQCGQDANGEVKVLCLGHEWGVLHTRQELYVVEGRTRGRRMTLQRFVTENGKEREIRVKVLFVDSRPLSKKKRKED